MSARAALFLRKEGYDAWALEGGLDAWIEAGYPTEEREPTGRNAGSGQVRR